MDEGKNITENNKGLKRSGILLILRGYLGLIIQIIILFVAAGRIDISRAWIFFGITFVYYAVGMMILSKLNPELLNIRGGKRFKQGTKSWDKVLLPAYGIMHYVLLAIVGLDVGRFQGSSLGINFAVLGFMFYIISAILLTWAMIANPHFETTVRIQKDRDHQVITTGPYKIIRHPGYAGGILLAISIPLIIGSLFGLIPAGIIILLLIIRTSLEDKTLLNELNGYSEYAKRVKYRLFPRVW
ncbi:MAG: isoprenylcysteine carboxylmethyltransferase family protein [archaeon]|nr:isoprenylcysteine carboxylmethyltransferase family protein [archaeon]MCP8306013.1 isoprenylcysteine carboxylmethyltransferase family protein [archaeon]